MQPPHENESRNWADLIDAIARNDIELQALTSRDAGVKRVIKSGDAQAADVDPAARIQNSGFRGS